MYELGQVKTWNTLAYRTQQIGGNRSDAARHQMRRMAELSVRSINCCGIANLNSRHRRNIDHSDVHRNNSNHGCEGSVNQHLTAVAQPAMNAVSIPCCKYTDPRRLLC